MTQNLMAVISKLIVLPNALHPLHAQAVVATEEEVAAMEVAATEAAVVVEVVVVVVVVVVAAMEAAATTTVTKINQILLQSRSYNDCHPYFSFLPLILSIFYPISLAIIFCFTIYFKKSSSVRL